MTKQILIIGAGVSILAAALVSILAVLGVVEFSTLWGTLGRILAIVLVVVAATVLIAGLAKLSKGN